MPALVPLRVAACALVAPSRLRPSALRPSPPPVQVGETYNIGTQKERSVVDVATDICKFFGLDPATHINHVKDRAFNDRRYFM